MAKIIDTLEAYFFEECEKHGYEDAVIKNIRSFKNEDKSTTAIADVEYTKAEKREKLYNVQFIYKCRCWGCTVLFGANYAQEQWEIVHDCDLEDGTPTVWSLKVADKTWYWIDVKSDGTFDVIGKDGVSVLKSNLKSFASANRWLKNYFKRG